MRQGSDLNQRRAAIDAYAARTGFEIIAEFEDLAQNMDRAEARPGFAALLKQICVEGPSTIILGTVADLAADAISRKVVFLTLRERGIEIIAADDPDAFRLDSREDELIARALELSLTLDQAIAAAGTRAAQRARTKAGKSWRRTYAEMVPDATLCAKKLNQMSIKTGPRLSLREISAKLAQSGFLTRDGKPYHPEAIRRMLKGAWPEARTA
jgi:hypothetical protein